MKKLKVKEAKSKPAKEEAKAEKMTKWDFKRREHKLFSELAAACETVDDKTVVDITSKLKKLNKRYHGQFKVKKTEG